MSIPPSRLQRNGRKHISLRLARIIACLILAGICAGSICRAQTLSDLEKRATRPPSEKRKFTSAAVEAEIVRATHAIADPEIGWIFQACYPNTLDTTVDFTTVNGKPETFIITGDINAMWLRDSCAPVQAYLPLCIKDHHLAEMIAGLIHRQAACILIDPYANAFQFDGSRPSPHRKDDTEMKPGVFERKWEVDSLCYCMRVAYQYWKITGDTQTFDSQWRDSMRLAVATFREQQREHGDGPYHFKRGARDGGPDGFGPPMKPTGMICTAFRDSDDRAMYQFNIPDNLFASSALRHLAEMADALMPGDKLAADARSLADQVDAGIKAFGIVDHPQFGKIYAYECDGLGHTVLMDDAGIPSLLAIPYLDPTLAGNPVVLASRRFSLSRADPWFIQGSVGEGVGSIHKGKIAIWHTSIISEAITSTDDAEITKCLATLTRSSAGTGFMHESFQKDDASKFSRKWFAWVNNFYGELILKMLKVRPKMLSKPIPANF
jgi:meiotically up-regulated gene 157 (Mug157) protein